MIDKKEKDMIDSMDEMRSYFYIDSIGAIL